MSRCAPFPPPGYALSSARKETMTELIKLHKEKQQRKEKKREKKEKRKERRERRKNKKDNTYPDSVIVKGHIGHQACSVFEDEFSEKGRDAKSMKFELSSLTEEHVRPNSLPIPSSSCDSTENTINWKKRASPEDDDSHGHSEAIFTRLPSLMDIEGINPRNNGKEICSTSGQTEAGKTIRSTSDAVNPMQGAELRYEDLVENWLPPQLQDMSLYTVDSDWLFHNREKRDEKRRRCGGGNVSYCRSLGPWPRADYLPEVGIFALPYVLPY